MSTEQPSKRAKVMQATVAIIVIFAALLALAAIMSQKGTTTLALPAEQPRTQPKVDDGNLFADRTEAMMARGLRPETEASASQRRGSSAQEVSIETLLDAMPKQPAYPMPAAQATPDPSERRAVDSRFSPLGGALRETASRPGSLAGGAAPLAGAAGEGGGVLAAGTVIDGRLSMQLSSDFAGGPWIATVSRPVYFNDGREAIPSGSTIIGSAQAMSVPNSVIQGRMQLAVERIVRPDGSEIALQAPALDASGVAAIPGRTKRHLLAQASGVLAVALLGAARGGATNNEPLSTRSQFESQAAAGAIDSATPAFERYLQVQPTVMPPAGTPIRVLLEQAVTVPAIRGVMS